jgi:hypothetical protein
MTWFKVDDTLATHPKARRAGLAAMGLWAVCGAYSSQHLTEGFVPEWYVKTWPKGLILAQKLVDSGLWTVSETEGGWVFHQWDERNPTKEEVEERRAVDRERQALWRAQQKEKKAALSRRDKTAGHAVTDAVTNAVSHAVSHTPCHGPPDPTRPDPTPVVVTNVTTTEEKSLPRKRGQRLQPDWIPSEATRAEMATQCPLVDLHAEHVKFIDHWIAKTGRDATKLDWDATWRNWIRNARPSTRIN